MDSGSGVVASQKVREPSFLAKRTWYVFMQIRIIKTHALHAQVKLSKFCNWKKNYCARHKEWLPTREIKLVKNCYPHRDIRRLAFVT